MGLKNKIYGIKRRIDVFFIVNDQKYLCMQCCGKLLSDSFEAY